MKLVFELWFFQTFQVSNDTYEKIQDFNLEIYK